MRRRKLIGHDCIQKVLIEGKIQGQRGEEVRVFEQGQRYHKLQIVAQDRQSWRTQFLLLADRQLHVMMKIDEVVEFT